MYDSNNWNTLLVKLKPFISFLTIIGVPLQCYECKAVDKTQCLATQKKTTCKSDGKSTGQCIEMTYSFGEEDSGVYIKNCLKRETSCQELCRHVEMANHVANCKVNGILFLFIYVIISFSILCLFPPSPLTIIPITYLTLIWQASF